MKTTNILKTVGLIGALFFTPFALVSCDNGNNGGNSTDPSNTQVAREFRCDGGTTFFGSLPTTTLFLWVSADSTTYRIYDSSNVDISVSGDILAGDITELTYLNSSVTDYAALKGFTANGNYMEIIFSETNSDYELVVYDSPTKTNAISAREGTFEEVL